MKYLKAIVLAVCLLTIVIAPITISQHIYLRMYWITGQVTDPDGKGIEGRWVVFYQTDPADAYSDDLGGTVGNSGRAGQYMINAYEDWRMALAPGTYKVAIVNGYVNGVPVDDYGADPVDVTVTGNGYDVAPNLVLAQGAGIAPPGPRPVPDWLAALMPKIDFIKFGERRWQPVLVAKGDKFIISSRPKITAKVVSPVALLTDSVAMTLNEGTSTVQTYRILSSHYTTTKSLDTGGYSEIEFVYDFTQESVDPLPESKDPQIIRIKGANEFGTTVEVCTVYIAGGEVDIVGEILAYPSPLRLRSDPRDLTIQYGLTKDANIDIYIFDISARIIKKMTFLAGVSGGQAGGTANPNKVHWNLISDQGSLTGSGIYLFNIIDRSKNRVLGKGKITIVP